MLQVEKTEYPDVKTERTLFRLKECVVVQDLNDNYVKVDCVALVWKGYRIPVIERAVGYFQNGDGIDLKVDQIVTLYDNAPEKVKDIRMSSDELVIEFE